MSKLQVMQSSNLVFALQIYAIKGEKKGLAYFFRFSSLNFTLVMSSVGRARPISQSGWPI